MKATSRPSSAGQLFETALGVWRDLACLTALRFAWLLAFPLVLYWTDFELWSAAVLAVGYGFDVLGQLLAQRLRRVVRARSLTRSAGRALDKAAPIPEANVDSAFWSAHLSETAIIVDVPGFIASAGALVAIGVLSLARLGPDPVLPAAALFLLALVSLVLTTRARAGLLADTVTRRLATAELLGAAERDAGEIAGAAARERYTGMTAEAAKAWSRAQDRVERRRLIQHACLGAGALLALLWLASRHGIDLLGLTQRDAVTLRSVSDLLLLGSALPIARVLAGHVDSLLVVHTSLSQLDLPRRRTHRAVRRLPAAPRRLSIDQLRYHYSDAVVLDVEHLRVDLTRPLLLTGDNGAGKTTLAAILAGVIEHHDGTVLLDGVDVRELARDDVAFVPQHPLLMLDRSIAENVALIAPNVRTTALKSLLSELGLDREPAHPMRELSRGEQQRVALARALAKQPKLLVLDEPDAWLDRAGREHLVTALERYVPEMALIIVTHRDKLKQLAGTSLELTAPATRSHLHAGAAEPEGKSRA